jgi:type VI secretion system protein VasJ
LRQSVQQQLEKLTEQWSGHGIALNDAWARLRSMLATADSDSPLDAATPPAARQSSHQAGENVIESSQMLLEQLRAMCSYRDNSRKVHLRHSGWPGLCAGTALPSHHRTMASSAPACPPPARAAPDAHPSAVAKAMACPAGESRLAFLEAANHFWLDLQYLAWQALGQLGESHQHWRDIALSDIALMRHRLCGIEQLCFADGSPFADDNTLEWLASQAVVYDLSGSDKELASPLISVTSTDLTDIGQQARLLAEQQGLEAALGCKPCPDHGLRQQAQQLLLTAQLAESSGRADIALGIVSGLEQELCSQKSAAGTRSWSSTSRPATCNCCASAGGARMSTSKPCMGKCNACSRT